jgi:hypothetical protein
MRPDARPVFEVEPTMPFSLYDAAVPPFIQITGALLTILEKGKAHWEGLGKSPDEALEARLCADMLPLRFQILSVIAHSIGAIQAVRAGVYSPAGGSPALDHEAVMAALGQAHEALRALSRDEVDALIGQPMRFEMGELKLPFSAEGYLMSFAQPNFYFHAATAYNILRLHGAPLGKRDFLGALQLKP